MMNIGLMVITEKWTALVESPVVLMVDRTVEEQPQYHYSHEYPYLKLSNPVWTPMLVEDISQFCSICLLNSLKLTMAGSH